MSFRFRTWSLIVAQLLSVTHEIYKSFDCSPPADKRGIFPDISKAFDKVCSEALIFKLKTYGIDGRIEIIDKLSGRS